MKDKGENKVEIKVDEGDKVQQMVDRLVRNAEQALKEYMELDQRQVDEDRQGDGAGGFGQSYAFGEAGGGRNRPRRI